MTVEDKNYWREDVTYNTFVNPDYRTHSQYTELYMVQEGFDFSDIYPGERIRRVAEAVRRYDEQKKQQNVKQKVLMFQGTGQNQK